MPENRERVGQRQTNDDLAAVTVVGSVGATILVLHAFGVFGRYSDVTLLVLSITAVVAAVWGIRRWRPDPVRPWVLLVVALVLFLAGGGARVLLGTLGNLGPDRSLLPDVLSLAGYGLLAMVIMTVVRLRQPGGTRDLDATLDAAIAGLAALTLAWVYLINPAVLQQHVPLSTRLLLACYPAMSVFLVALGARMLFGTGSWSTSPLALRLLMFTLVGILVGDVVYMFADLGLIDPPLLLIDLPYGLAYVAGMAALLHPSIRDVARPSTQPAMVTAVPHRGRMAFVAVALCVPALITLSHTERGAGDRVVLSAIVIACTSAAAWRMFRALREHGRSEVRLDHQANHDGLTGLPNRPAVQAHLTGLMGDSTLHMGVVLLFLDLDRFKLINDSLGHGVGDELLVAVGQRLEQSSRPGDLVGRIGGDEFVVVAADVANLDEASDLAERTRLSLTAPFVLGDAEISVVASVGVALRRTGGRAADAGEMFRDADTAMYRAKASGGDAIAVFDATMREKVARRLELERALRHALDRGELHLAYQPVVQTIDGRVVGMEALLRWSHPTLGQIDPSVFVPIAEDTGLIVEIGVWVLERACSDLATIRRTIEYGSELTMAVNMSVRQLRNASLLDHVARSLLRNGLSASALRLELTESMVMENLSLVSSLLASLRSYGVGISIDDFGTGYSSLASLGRLPVDEVKIDRSFVTGLGDDDANTSLIAAVVAIADSLGIATVVEGVEQPAQARRIEELGCNRAQGYFYSRPVALVDLPAVIERLGLAGAPTLRMVPPTALDEPEAAPATNVSNL
jgi:diguanylate cyclase (GGDEF)-like protein